MSDGLTDAQRAALRKARLDRGMTMGEAAALVGSASGNWSTWERGTKLPRAATMAAIKRVFGVDLLRARIDARATNDTFRFALKRQREARGMIRADVGEIAGVTADAVGFWEDGRSLPRKHCVEALRAAGFDLPEPVRMRGSSTVTDHGAASPLVRAIAASGLSDREIRDAIGVSCCATSRWRRGVSRPSPANLRKLEALLGVSIDIEPRAPGRPKEGS